MIREPVKFAFIIGGWISLGLGVIGIFLPIVPTTPFVILSAFCFSKGSKRLHDWLLAQPKMGKMIEEWEAHQVIRPKAKKYATLMMVVSVMGSAYLLRERMILVFIMASCMAAVSIFIWTRPSRPPEKKS